MNITEKREFVGEVKKMIDASNAVFLLNNLGLNAEDVYSLRKQVRQNGGEVKVVKNTLAKIALKDHEYSKIIDELFNGPTTLAFSYQDPVGIAKLLVNMLNDNKKIEVKGGALGNRKLTLKDIQTLAKLPGKKELIGKTVATIAAPLRNFMGVLSAVPRDFVNVLVAIKNEKEKTN